VTIASLSDVSSKKFSDTSSEFGTDDSSPPILKRTVLNPDVGKQPKQTALEKVRCVALKFSLVFWFYGEILRFNILSISLYSFQ